MNKRIAFQSPHAITIKTNGRAQVITSQITVSTPLSGMQDRKIAMKQMNTVAMWDTGASGCAVSARTAQALNLRNVGVIKVQTFTGFHLAPTYLVDFVLPNNTTFESCIVTQGNIGQGEYDVIIGMDIISRGDFAISQDGGDTMFSYRVPSQGPIDFTKKR